MSTYSLRQYYVNRSLDPGRTVRNLLPGVQTISLRSLVAPILDTYFPAPAARTAPVDTSPTAKLFLSDGGPRWEWTPMVDPNDEFDTPGTNLVGASGTVIWAKGSDKDNPCSHPFVPASVGHGEAYDWVLFLAVDPGYERLLARSNDGTGDPDPKGDYNQAMSTAKAMDLPAAKGIQGVLGVEIDGYLAPTQYRALDSYRVAVFGRWIVDTGHPDFHYEIHPPLLWAGAHTDGQQTLSTVVARPYLVSQMYEPTNSPAQSAAPMVRDSDGALFEHLTNEFNKLKWGPTSSTKVEAHCVVFGYGRTTGTPGSPPGYEVESRPFRGNPTMTYTVRPPYVPGHGTQCMASFCFIVRTGVTVSLAAADDGGAVRVSIYMNEGDYIPAALPAYHDWIVSWDDIEKLRPGTKDAITAILNKLKWDPATWNALTDKSDITVSHFDQPEAPNITDSDLTTTNIADLAKVAHFRVDNTQPFPVCGRLTLRWQ